MILSYDAYTEAVQDSEIQKSRIDKLALKFEELENHFKRDRSKTKK
jgi:hypothetical protein